MSRFELLADDRAEAISGGYGGWSLPMLPSPAPSTTNKVKFTKVVATTDVTSTQKNYNNSQAALLGFVKTSQFNNASISVNTNAVA
jgi:hypothetical protein